MSTTDEKTIAYAVLRIASQQANKIATYDLIRTELPKLINLNRFDLKQSKTREKEPMWHQIMRNIKSHDTQEGNYIFEGYLEHISELGYKITQKGERKLILELPN